MRKLFLALLLTISATSSVFAHDEENGISIDSKISSTVNAGTVHYVFDLYDNEEKRNLTDKDLAESHEKILHLFVYDSALKEFKHLHPSYVNDEWTVDFNLDVNGKYWIWAQGALASDGNEFSSFENVNVINGKTENATPTVLEDIRTASDDISLVNLTGKAIAQNASMLMVKFSRTDGSVPDITDYLGAFAHIVIVPADGSALIHAHPMATGKPNEGMVHVTFPKEGDYRVWIQFMDAGILRTTALSVKVLK
ncbi:MAG: hypothetical protein K2Q18_08415 [Bdellovibrionales bacterium]|nr:hypothetical protein [Bdellovibrionales bacterium]